MIKENITYRKLKPEEIDRALFAGFRRRQEVTRCLRKIDGEWKEQNIAFIDDWSEEDYRYLITCLQDAIQQGGVVIGAFQDGILKGFCCVEGRFLGIRQEYLDLASLHVSEDLRGSGIGRELFQAAACWAQERGGKKLYISGHSAVETQAFYKAMGCREADEYQQEHVEKEPCDCQLEYVLPALME